MLRPPKSRQCHATQPWHLAKTQSCKVSQTQPWYLTQKDAKRDTITKNKQKNTYSQWQGHSGDKVAERGRAEKTKLRRRRGRAAKRKLSRRIREREKNRACVLIYLNLSSTSISLLKTNVNQVMLTYHKLPSIF